MRFPEGVMPNSWHKGTFKLNDTDNCHEINFYKIWVFPDCPITAEPVSIHDCHKCEYGFKGDQKEGTCLCNHPRWEDVEEKET